MARTASLALLCLLAAPGARGAEEKRDGKSAWEMFAGGILGGSKAKPDPQPMKVIGAGFGRTASNSLMLALEQLGHKTYHMEKAIGGGHIDDWGAVHAGTGAQDDAALERVLDRIAAEGYTAGVDFPLCIAYKELMKRNPESPVILSTRKDPETWAKSFIDTIDHLENAFAREEPPLSLIFPRFYNMSKWIRWRAGIPWHPTIEQAAAAYTAWLEDVKAHVPKERLLVWQVSQGWAPICAHLKIPAERCPTGSFPRGQNDTADMQFAAKMMNFAMDWFYQLTVFAIVAVLSFLRLVCRCCCGAGSGEKQKKS